MLILLTLRYLHWRISETLNWATPLSAALSLVLLTAELWLQAHWLLLLVFSLTPEAKQRQRPQATGRDAPARVDLLVPSCGEPLEVVERCLRGCRTLADPGVVVWLLDDAGDPALQEICRQLGCRYRHRDNRDHAKAGNLNHVLQELRGELVAVFDADVVPLENFLERTCCLFDDPAVGLVQTPQSYMNADPVIRNLGLERWLLPDEESFYRWIEPVRQRLNAVVCAGTSFVVRRQALLDVGGFETGTPSEDIATGIRITAAGWRCLFVAEKLSAGLAPFTVASLVRQRCRWASGTLQIMRTTANPLRIAGLTILQRLAFLEGILHWLNVIPQLILLLISLSVGWLGVAPLVVSGDGLLQVALPLLVAQLLLTRWITGHSRTALMPELYRWLLLMPLASTVLRTVLGHPQPFQVTPKALAARASHLPEPTLVLPLLGLLCLQLWSWVTLLPDGWRPEWIRSSPVDVSQPTLDVLLIWGALNMVLLLAAIRCCIDRGRRSTIPWLAWNEAVMLNGRAARLTALSEEGLELTQEQRIDIDPTCSLVLETADGRCWPVLPARQQALGLGCRWGHLTEQQREVLQHRLFRSAGRWPVRRAPAEPLALMVLLGNLLGIRCAERWFQRSLVPVTGARWPWRWPSWLSR